MPLPLIKLLTLFIKQASKPMANALQRQAKQNPTFRKICIAPANLYHIWEVNVKMKMLGLGKTKTKHKMDPDMAVELGTNMIGEAFLYLFASAILVGEYTYLSRNSERKEQEKQQRLLTFENRIVELGSEVDNLNIQVQKIEELLKEMEQKNKGLLERLHLKSG